MRRPLDDILQDLRGAASRTMPSPDLKKIRAAGLVTKVRRSPRLPWAVGAAVLVLAFGFGGAYLAHHGLPAGQSQVSLPVPQGFWSLKSVQQRAATFRIFPYRTGSMACSIDHGGPGGPSYTPLHGICTTEVLTRQTYLETFPKGPRPARIWRAVMLSESWKGPASEGQHTAAWVFLLDDQGRLLHVMVSGLPPQNWR